MKERVRKVINKADDTLESARLLFAEGHFAGAVNRAYYAMFDAFRSLLFVKGVFVKTHKGLQSKLYELYFDQELLPQSLNTILTRTEDLREKADYDFDSVIDSDTAGQVVSDASLVLDEIKIYLRSVSLLSDNQ